MTFEASETAHINTPRRTRQHTLGSSCKFLHFCRFWVKIMNVLLGQLEKIIFPTTPVPGVLQSTDRVTQELVMMEAD